MKFIEKAQSIQSELVELRRKIHMTAETGMNLEKTSKIVVEELKKLGIDSKVIAHSGVVCEIGGKKPGKVFLIRADMDALPILEEADVDFKATNSNMHACGHDLHTTMLLGAARLLKDIEDEIEGTVKLMFQPAEETLLGAKAMIDEGVLENPKVDAALMIHAVTGLPVPSGMVLVPNEGPLSSSSDKFEIYIKGKGGHGSMPDQTVDPLNVMSHIHIALQAIISREVSATNPSVLTVGKMEGGFVSNIIPDSAYMEGTIRAFCPKNRAFIIKRLEEICTSVAATFRAEVKVVFPNGCGSIVVDKDVSTLVRNTLVEELGEDMVADASKAFPGGKFMGSEDFSFVSDRVPGILLGVFAGNSEEGYIYPLHHPKVMFDESALKTGAAVYASTAVSWLKQNK